MSLTWRQLRQPMIEWLILRGFSRKDAEKAIDNFINFIETMEFAGIERHG